MKLERLRVERLPGLVRGFDLAPVSPGLNLVVGPNASGKTSLCRALRALLYGEEQGGPITVEADFRDARGLLRASRQGGDRRWTRDGRPVEPPALPEERFASYFTVLLENLLVPPGPREPDPIAARVATLLAGGYDLAQLRKEGGPFALKPRHATSERDDCRKSAQLVREVGAKHQRIRAEEDRLEELRLDKRAADEADAQARACERALDLLAARQSRSEE
ncbi:MAG: AAA family ATPase, partial [Planctomycetes bacterium]|nr:AAA family ATPase [Planctomycetota bacterium]